MARRRTDTWTLSDNGQIVFTEATTGITRCGYAHEMPSAAFARLTPSKYAQIYNHFQRHRETIADQIQAETWSAKLRHLKAYYDARRAA